MSRSLAKRAVPVVAMAAGLAASACSSGSDDRAVSTMTSSSPPHRVEMAELLDRLDCDFTDAGDYESVGGEATRGVDCWRPEGQLRVHVYASRRDQATPAEDFGIVVEDQPSDAPARWRSTFALRGDRWFVMGSTADAIIEAQEHIGGEFVRAGPPASYVFPTEVPVDARRRARGDGAVG